MSSVDTTIHRFLINNKKRIILPMTTQMISYQYNTNELLAAETLANLQFTSNIMATKPLHEYIDDDSLMTGSTFNLSPMTSFFIPFSTYQNYHDKIAELSEISFSSTWSKKQSDSDMEYEDGSNVANNESDEDENVEENDVVDDDKDDDGDESNIEENMEEFDNRNVKKEEKYNINRYHRHSKRLHSIGPSPFYTTVVQSNYNNITKPRWSNKERSKLLIAVIEEKQLENLSTFRWKEISKQLNSKRSCRACRYQWKYELLPRLKTTYE
ncbi:unnamed protein product [Cunninghamella blakesleeana]